MLKNKKNHICVGIMYTALIFVTVYLYYNMICKTNNNFGRYLYF